MKKVLIWMVCFLFVLTSCSSKVLLKDDGEAGNLTEEMAKYIILSYNSTFPIANTIAEGEQIPYEKAFLYFGYGGFYKENGQLREELNSYLDEGIYYLPAQIVDNYLLSKFDTQIEHDVISAYDEKTKMYVVRPAETFVGKISVDSITALDDKKYQILATIQDDVSLRLLLQTVTIKYDGEYRFLSVQQKEPYQELNAEEQFLISFVEDYYHLNSNLTFDSENKLTYDQIFSWFSVFGFWDENGNLRSDFKDYATGELYDPYQVPASIVDEYLITKFDVVVDPSLIDCYDAQKNCYMITPRVSDWYNVVQLISYEKSESIYTVIVKALTWDTDTNKQMQKFCLEIENNNCKYLSVTNVQ